MAFDSTKSASQQIRIDTIEKLNKIIKIKHNTEGLRLSRPAVLEYLVTQELAKLQRRITR
jgi:hypothetical protein